MKKPKKPTVMQRTRAAVAIINAMNSPSAELAAFLAIFHPEMTDDRRTALIREAKLKKRLRR